jgi:hypothetical protein
MDDRALDESTPIEAVAIDGRCLIAVHGGNSALCWREGRAA